MAPPRPTARLAHAWALLWPEEKLCLGALAAALVITCSTGTSFTFDHVIEGYQPLFGANLVLLVVVSRLVQVWRKRRPSATAWTNGIDLDAEAALLRCTAFLFAYMVVYTNVKARIPVLNPSIHDGALHQLEITLLGGFDVEARARAIAAFPTFARLLDRIYHHDYVFMTFTALFLHLQAGPRHLRHLFVSMAVLYLGGVAITALWPTQGPCFYNRDAYTWMKGLGLDAWDSQDMLLKAWRAAVAAGAKGSPLSAKAFTGIAAMPSLHVGHCLLLCRFAWHYSRRALWLLAPITLLTWLSTLAFGWHYLADGVAVIPLVLVSWEASRRIVFGREAVGLRDPAPVAAARQAA